MAFRFSNATAVAAGTFNIYVIQPRWLVEVGLIRDGIRLQLKSDMNRPGFLYSSDELGVQWDVRPDRLTLIAKTAKEDCGSLLAAVIEKLPWTPLAGVGSNIEFEGEISDTAGFPSERRLPACEPPGSYTCKQRTVHFAFGRGPHIFNFQASVEGEKAGLSINVHTELKDRGPQEAISMIARRACREHLSLLAEAAELAQRMFCVELSYEPNSN